MMMLATRWKGTAIDFTLLTTVNHATCFKWPYLSLAECEVLKLPAVGSKVCREYQMVGGRGEGSVSVHWFKGSFFFLIWPLLQPLKIVKIRWEDLRNSCKKLMCTKYEHISVKTLFSLPLACSLYTVFQNLLALACFSLPKRWPFISCTELRRVKCKFGRSWQPRL